MSEALLLRMVGLVTAYDHDDLDSSPSIGGRMVVDAIVDAFGAERFQANVMLGVEANVGSIRGSGDMEAWWGFTGTDVTPADPPTIHVGGLDLVEKLHELDGREVVLEVRRIVDV